MPFVISIICASPKLVGCSGKPVVRSFGPNMDYEPQDLGHLLGSSRHRVLFEQLLPCFDRRPCSVSEAFSYVLPCDFQSSRFPSNLCTSKPKSFRSGMFILCQGISPKPTTPTTADIGVTGFHERLPSERCMFSSSSHATPFQLLIGKQN